MVIRALEHRKGPGNSDLERGQETTREGPAGGSGPGDPGGRDCGRAVPLPGFLVTLPDAAEVEPSEGIGHETTGIFDHVGVNKHQRRTT